MSKLRPTLVSKKPEDPSLTYDQTYFRVLQSVSARRGLIHGDLDDGSNTCALGAYFRDANIALNGTAIEEISAYNDSFPNLTRNERWKKVMAWLRTKVKK